MSKILQILSVDIYNTHLILKQVIYFSGLLCVAYTVAMMCHFVASKVQHSSATIICEL